MKTLISRALRYQDNQLLVLDQQALPAMLNWIICHSPNDMYDMIRALKVRGAPLIGIAAALAFAQYAEQGASYTDMIHAANYLKRARPTAVNLMYCIDQQLQVLQQSLDPLSVVPVAEKLFMEDALLCEKIANYGASLIISGDNILTHCNTGALVTTGIGTALGVITKSYQQEKNLHVYVDETRPLLQGSRLTAWELQEAGLPYTLICDNMAASLMRAGKIQKIIVGADRIASNGDFANKIGTYNLAALAKFHNIPFYVAAPYTTIDLQCETGDAIQIEERTADEVRGASGSFGTVIWSTPDANVYNPAFDVTPANLVTSFILDIGIVKPEQIFQFRLSQVKVEGLKDKVTQQLFVE